ncbi:hypothetical protein DL765_007504 [Monosporascus sp. GIB2]|nr:hypothetical protein DL765_007504 [Monosporascus sp. GIB2]
MAGRTAIGNGHHASASRDNSKLLSPPRVSNGKEKRNPSITPRKFRRFFTPRSRVSSHVSPARKALQDLAGPALNQRYQTPAPSSPLKPLSGEQFEDDYPDRHDDRSAKRRKVQHHTPESSPCRPALLSGLDTPKSSPCNGPMRKRVLLSPIRSLNSSQELLESEEDGSDDDLITGPQPVKRITPLTGRGLAGQLMQRQSGSMPRAGRSYMSYPAADWRIDTADFCSRPDQVHSCISHEGPGRCIPFCAATCHTNSLMAVGDEEGRIRLLDSSGDASHPFSDIHLTFPAHPNAIIDVAFSNDDYLLATASGDQTGRVIDMMTQTPIAVLQHHTASLKQVRFQPGKANSSVLATSSRDGSVQIWDLRCFGGPVQDIPPPQGRESTLGFRRPQPKHGCAVNSLYNAHARTQRQTQQAFTVGPGDTPSRGELPGRIGDVSVTALQFLPPGREFLLLTACESDTSIKLWDVRSIHTSRQKTPSPLSVTAPPASHSNWRPFGISSLALNTDGSRLYAVCKDNTVYAYSTAHLMLGHAPELSTRNGEPARRRYGAVTQQGLGPLYGFRHPLFHAASFYVKCAVRPAREGRSELLAVGSSDSRAILFPTDERHFADDLHAASMGALSLENSTIATTTNPCPTMDHLSGTRRPLFGRNNSSLATLASFSASNSNINSDIPIVRNAGTPLVRGHDREVGAVAWTAEGKLVTVGDDFSIRCWGEDRERAADLRTGGETGGRRWGCGWADVGDDWDASDDDEDGKDDEC